MSILLIVGKDTPPPPLHATRVVTAREDLLPLGQGRDPQYRLIVLAGVLSAPETCRTLRQQELTTPILVLEPQLTDSLWEATLDAGADVVLSLHTAPSVLQAQLDALLRRQAHCNQALTIGGLHLDIVNHRAEREGVSIPLSTTEYRLLFLLMSRAGAVVSRAEIMKQVWPEGEIETDNVLDVYISYLRGKIDRPFDYALIQTVRGQGYRLCPPTTP